MKPKALAAILILPLIASALVGQWTATMHPVEPYAVQTATQESVAGEKSEAAKNASPTDELKHKSLKNRLETLARLLG